jgi:pyridinium-3,5-bisthiocarboxylic acid mononucleotide nickel chelatase
MSKIAYFECPTGVAGDMCLAALLDAGLPMAYLEKQLAKLGISAEYRLTTSSVRHQGQTANHVDVELLDAEGHLPDFAERSAQGNSSHPHHHHHHSHPHSPHQHQVLDKEQHYHSPQRNLPVITGLIDRANLPPRAAQWSKEVFRQLAIAEGIVHGIAPELVHFHEVGAVDAIVDIVGTCLGLDYLDIDEIYCSPLPTGGGTVRAAHGTMPVPVPAVLQLWKLRQVPVYSNGIDRELVTPTGAALMVAMAKSFGAAPAMALHQIGLGAGTLQLPVPNILRLWIGETQDSLAALEEIWVLETQVDDLNPQIVGYLFDRLLAAGAVDVFSQPVAMKKSRPGILITVVCHPEKLGICEQIVFRETTTLGIRRSRQERSILPRQMQTVQTTYGPVRVKVASSNLPQQSEIWNIQPEYADCAALADRHQVPWQTVHDAARLAMQQQVSGI